MCSDRNSIPLDGDGVFSIRIFTVQHVQRMQVCVRNAVVRTSGVAFPFFLFGYVILFEHETNLRD